jgi:hypothetical protein
MRFLRMLTNSLIAGALGASYLTVLVLQLNPQVPIVSDTTLRWFATLSLFYGVHLAVMFYALMMAREFFSLDTLSPGWASVRVLAWLAAALAAAASALMWLNVRGFEAVLGEVATRRMTAGAAATSVSAVVLLGIAVAHYSFGRRGSRVGAALFAMAAFGSLALPLAARGPATTQLPVPTLMRVGLVTDTEGPRVTMLLLDGGSLEYIRLRAAEGRLPNFSRLLDMGATLDLATVRPTGPGPVWTSIATGLYPHSTGVRSGASYAAWNASQPVDLLPDHCFSHALVHFGVVREEPSSSSAWRARPLWSILSDAGIPVGIVRWPLTYPAPQVEGFLVSDRFHELLGSMLELDERAAYPSSALPVVREAFAATPEEDGSAVASAAATVTPPDTPELSAGLRDRAYSRTFRTLRARTVARFVALRYQGLDTVGHFYMGDTQPAVVADSNQHDRRRHVQVLDRYYTYIDDEVGAALAALVPGDLLLVVSGYGMQRQNPLRQIVGKLLGDPDLTGTHNRAPDGFLLAYGTAVQVGLGQRGSIVDVAPTVLYFLGLPIGRDMDGYARTDIFTRGFTAERPVAYIPSYNR